MTTFRASPFNKAQGELVKAKVVAFNERGQSLTSAETAGGAPIEVEPYQITTLASGSGTSHLQVQIEWIAPDDGGSPISSYVIYWDQGTGDDAQFIELVGETSQLTATSFTVSNGVAVGETYRFKIKAVNRWGSSDLSAPPLSVLAASRPEQIAEVATSFNAADGGVLIEWSLPDKLGSDLTSYLVEIKSSLGSWLTDDAGCA